MAAAQCCAVLWSNGHCGDIRANPVTPPLQTNRDLYLAIDGLSKQHENCSRPLEVYLLAVLNRSIAFSERESLTLSEFFELIACGFTHDPAPFDDAWRDQYDSLNHEDDGYAGWHATWGVPVSVDTLTA